MNVIQYWRKLGFVVAITLTLAFQGTLAAGGGTGNMVDRWRISPAEVIP